MLVYISESTLANSPYLSPIDRGILARLIQAVDRSGAKLIGLDVILDRATEPEKDKALRDAIRHTNAKTVLGVIQEASGAANFPPDYFFAKADGKDPDIGHLYLDTHHHVPLVVSDHVIRFMAKPPAGTEKPDLSKSFAEAVAHAAGTDFKPASHYIYWLLPPKGEETFLTLRAEALLDGKANLPDGLLKDKIVLIGGNFQDRDQHLTPLSASRDDFYPGLFIHAQIVAQLLGKHSIYEVGYWIQAILGLCALFGGYSLGRRAGHSYLWLELGSVAGLIVLGILAFYLLKIIFPYNVVLIAWLTGAAAGHYGRFKAKPAHPE